MATPFFFYFLAGVAIDLAPSLVIKANPVHSALALIVTLLACAGLYLMLYAPFVAGVQIVLYAGGIVVMFLFVIMLVNLEQLNTEKMFNKQWLVALAGGRWRRAAASCCAILSGAATLPTGSAHAAGGDNTQQIGRCCSTRITCCRLKWRRCCCWWRSWAPWSWRRGGCDDAGDWSMHYLVLAPCSS